MKSMKKTSFLDCKHKHMMKSGAPPDKFGILYLLEFHGFTSRINSKGYHSLVPGLISVFIEMVWVPLTLTLTFRLCQALSLVEIKCSVALSFLKTSLFIWHSKYFINSKAILIIATG